MIKSLKVRDFFETYTWCYFYIDEKTNHGFLIDPGAEAEKILAVIKENDWTIEKILLTHGHFDHTEAVETISNVLNIPYYIHTKGKKYLESTHYNLSKYCNRTVILKDAEYLNDNELISLKPDPDINLKAIYTPGHTEDSVIFYSERAKLAFVGDTIFHGSLGSTEYPGGNKIQLQDSIVNEIFTLPNETVLFPGHSESTTVGKEKARYGFGG